MLNRFRTSLDDEVRGARIAVTLVFALNGALVGSWAARIPALRDRLELGPGALGIALAGIAAGALMAMPLAGSWAARAGSRRVTRVALVGACASVSVVALAPSLAVLVLGTLALGVTNGGLDVAMNAQGTAVERRAGRLVLSSLHAAFSAGGLVGAAAGSLAAGAGVDARVHLAVVGGLALAVGAFATRRLLPGSADATPGGPSFARPGRALWALGFLAFCCLLAEGAAADWSAVYIREDLAAPAGIAGLAYAGFSAAMTLGRLAGDRLVTALGSVRVLRVSGTVAGAGLAGALVVATPGAALAGFTLLGAGLSVIVPLVFRSAAGTSEAAAGPSLAAVSTMGYLGFLAGPPLVGALAELTSLPGALAVVAALAGMTALLAPAASGARHAGGRVAPSSSPMTPAGT